jgi:hypothetical protein
MTDMLLIQVLVIVFTLLVSCYFTQWPRKMEISGRRQWTVKTVLKYFKKFPEELILQDINLHMTDVCIRGISTLHKTCSS